MGHLGMWLAALWAIWGRGWQLYGPSGGMVGSSMGHLGTWLSPGNCYHYSVLIIKVIF
jgi:hypothetical protein